MSKKIVKNTAIYTIGTILPQAVNLVLLPVYTNYLSPAEFGIYTSITMLGAILIIFFTLGFERSLYRLYFDYKTDNEKKVFLGTVIISISVFSTIFCLLLLLGRNIIGHIFESIPVYPYYILIFFIIYSSVLPTIAKIFFQINQQAGRFVLFSLGQFFTISVGSLLLLIHCRLKAEGLLLGQLIGNALWIPVSIFIFKPHIKLKIKKSYLKNIFNFSLPMIPALLSAWVINLSDRIFIEHYFSTYEVGIYSLGYQIAQVASILTRSISKAYNPFFYQMANKGNNRQKLQQYNHTILVLLLIISFVLALFATDILTVFFDKEYFNAYIIVILISFSYLIASSSGLLNLSIYQEKRTLAMMFLVLFSAIINVGLNFLLIPVYGYLGAAYATIITYLIFFIIKYQYAKKCYFVPYKWNIIIPLVITSVLLVSGFSLLNFETIYKSIIIKIIVLCLFASLIFIIHKNDIKQFIHLLTKA